ncbi:hypothetical protein CASFOL_005260 [Castilleja foliolosa]|uniref:Uncharacterized protein n=1 Tax=Castilleja foliolosa TaxID=1961234 RepID=A0ABD3E473_9LAMI
MKMTKIMNVIIVLSAIVLQICILTLAANGKIVYECPPKGAPPPSNALPQLCRLKAAARRKMASGPSPRGPGHPTLIKLHAQK